ncbi:MAG: hypothetical protein HYV19_10185 [Gemmatimonadetes bacterium]|nr:hypothetical protein [Gemmatimonadota bacterium]
MRAPSVYTDVDGTLLGDDDQLAFPNSSLREAAARARLILTSSRSLDELAALAVQWDVSVDLIAENGACIARRTPTIGAERAAVAGSAWWIRRVGTPRTELRRDLLALGEAHGVAVDLADEWPVTVWRAETGQSVDAAKRARLRRGSVLLSDVSPSFAATLRAAGFDAEPGGRWTCVTRGVDKGRAARLHAALCDGGGLTYGIGDAANDRSLLESVDRAFIVRRRDGSIDPALANLAPRAQVLTNAGPSAWPELLQHLPPAPR